MMTDYRTIICPHEYFPTRDDLVAFRFEEIVDSQSIAYLDFFYTENEIVLLKIWLAEDLRDGSHSVDFCRKALQSCANKNTIVSVNVNDRMKQIWDQLTKEFPEKQHRIVVP